MFSEFQKGILKENPLFVQVLGVCPALATTTSLTNALGMGAAFSLVLIFSNLLISALKSLIPDQIRIPCYIVVIASLVTITEMLMNALVPDIYAALGIFIPLIVVNCIILGRAEAFASKNGLCRHFTWFSCSQPFLPAYPVDVDASRCFHYDGFPFCRC